MVWHEFWYNKDEEQQYIPPIFKTNNSNFPKKHSTPEGLKNMLAAVKSKINDPMNRNKTQPNLPTDLLLAMKELINLQKQREIIIKLCDKGASIILLDFKEYFHASNVHLNSQLLTHKGTTLPYYTKTDQKIIDSANNLLDNIIIEAEDNDIITHAKHKEMVNS